MWDAITMVCANLSISCENLILIVFTVGGLPFFAVDWKLGLMIEFIGSGLLFMWFFADSSMDWSFALTAMFIWLVVLSLTLYTVNKTGVSKGQIT